MRKELDRSIPILNKYGIGLNDCANLMIASKGKDVHTVSNSKKVADLLEVEDKTLQNEIKCGNLTQKKANEKMEKYLQLVGHTVFGGYK